MLKAVLEEGLDRLQCQSELSMRRNWQIPQLLGEGIEYVNAAVLAAARAELQYNGMGTTLVAALFHRDKVAVAHVGDSRVYQYRNGDLMQITRNHSLLQEQIDAGLVNPEWARFAQNRNLVTRAIGVSPDVEVEIHDHHTEPGGVYLLCSDGLSDMLADHEIRDLLATCSTSLETACNALIARANDNGGHDNISAILTRVHESSMNSSGMVKRIWRWMK